MPDAAYSLADLCGLADVTPRTVRYYISQGLLRPPGTLGPGARYDDGHLARLRLIRRLQREHLPLAEIRSRLAALSDDEAIAEAEGPAEPPPDTALDYVRGVLGARMLRAPVAPDRLALAPVAPDRPSRAALEAAPATRATPAVPVGPAPARAHASPPLRRLADAAPPVDRAQYDAAGAAAANPVPPAAERSHWERFVLAPDVELHVRRPLTRSQNRAVARLLEAARELLEEDLP